MKYRYFINKSDEARLPVRVLDENSAAYLGGAHEETSFSDWWERGIAMDTRSRAVDSAVEAGKMSSFIMEGEELSLVDGEPMEGREQPEVAQEQTVDEAQGDVKDHLRTMYDDEMVEALDNGGCGCEVKDQIMCVTK